MVTILSLNLFAPLFSAGITTLVSAFFFAAVLTYKRRWHEVMYRPAWKDIIFATVYIGIIFYGLMFIGLRSTNAGNAAIIGLMETFFAWFLLGHVLRHERVSPVQLFGGILMIIGAASILAPKASGWHIGDLVILTATAFAPLGNRHAQFARKLVSSETIMFWRSVIGGAFLLLIAFVFEPVPVLAEINKSAFVIVFNGFLLLGLSKILWIEGISRITITEATAWNSITPLFTMIFAYFLLQEKITWLQIAGFVPIAIGVLFLTKSKTSSTV